MANGTEPGRKENLALVQHLELSFLYLISLIRFAFKLLMAW